MIRILALRREEPVRHRVRTLLTVSGAAVALFVFAVVGRRSGRLGGPHAKPAGRALADRLSGESLLPRARASCRKTTPPIAKMPGVADVVPSRCS